MMIHSYAGEPSFSFARASLSIAELCLFVFLLKSSGRQQLQTVDYQSNGALLLANNLLLVYITIYESFATVGEIRVWWRADFQSGSRVLKKVF